MKEVIRIYHFSDAAMLVHAKAVYAFLQSDLAEFTAFDSTINAAFLAAYLAVLTAAETDVSDNVIIDRQVQLSDKATEKLKECIKAYIELAYFIRKAFDNKAIQNELGLSEFAEARKSKSSMILFFRDLNKVLPIYRDQLVSAGCSATLIDSLEPLHTELNAVSTESELYKGNRLVITQERVEKYNELWIKVKEVIDASKIIYRNNLPKLKRYLAPRNGSQSKDIKVAAHSRLMALNGGLDADSYLEIKNTGKSPLVFYVSNSTDTATPENAVMVNAGENSTIKTESISDGGYKMLIAANESTVDSTFIAQMLE